jgi:phage shock protein E
MKTISPERLQKEGKGFILLDVRTEQEYKEFHLPGSILIPYDEVEDRHKEIGADSDSKIYVICRSGQRSAVAVSVLESLGYTNAYNVEGGLVSF